MTDRTDRTEFAVVLNAGSGRKRGDTLSEDIRAAFRRRGAAANVEIVGDEGDLVQAIRAAAAAAPSVVVGGGDGTVRAAAAALRDREVRLGLIPLGTFNYFARSLGIPLDPAAAVDAIVDGEARPMRIATINGSVFLNNISLGIYPAILQEREEIYGRWGRSRVAAYWSVLRTLATPRRSLRLEVEVDGAARTVRTPLAFAINNVFQLDQMGLEGREEIAAGRLVVLMAERTGRWRMIRNALALAIGQARKRREYDMLAGVEITIRSARKRQTVACDGERMRLSSPFVLRTEEGALQLIAPPEFGPDRTR